MHDDYISVSVNDDNKIVMAHTYADYHNRKCNIMTMRYDLTIEETEDLINMLLEAIELVEERVLVTGLFLFDICRFAIKTLRIMV